MGDFPDVVRQLFHYNWCRLAQAPYEQSKKEKRENNDVQLILTTGKKLLASFLKFTSTLKGACTVQLPWNFMQLWEKLLFRLMKHQEWKVQCNFSRKTEYKGQWRIRSHSPPLRILFKLPPISNDVVLTLLFFFNYKCIYMCHGMIYMCTLYWETKMLHLNDFVKKDLMFLTSISMWYKPF